MQPRGTAKAALFPLARRQRSWEVDVQRARALRGDALDELAERQREWVWRSLLRGVRLSQATRLAQLSAEETPQALQQVANRYSAHMDHRRQERLALRSMHGQDAHIKEEEANRNLVVGGRVCLGAWPCLRSCFGSSQW
jgi:hypothetical protein